MTADHTIIFDGQTIKPGEEIPDLGSFVATEAKGNIRHYEGLSADVSKLPKYVDTGSSALCLDTGQYYKFHKDTQMWYEL